MKFGYADPPYPGRAYYYKDHPDFAGEVDHAALINRLVDEFPDGWALSTASSALYQILPLCPAKVRVMAWVKPFCSFKPGINPAYAWEPLLVVGGRKRTREQTTVRDWTACNITLKKGLTGVKPYDFCAWLFDVLGMTPEDDLADLFPGSGAVSTAFEMWKVGGPVPKERRDVKTQKASLAVPEEFRSTPKGGKSE